MTFNTSGFVLEGIRLATSNNIYTYPPRTVKTSDSFSGMNGRAEYMIWVGGQKSDSDGLGIGDSELVFYWSRNNNSITRFDWDGFNKRWMTSPGSGLKSIGIFGNSPRLVAPVPDDDVSFNESPYYIFIGYPDRIITFNIVKVTTSDDFGSPVSGTVEISKDKGELNFSQQDLTSDLYINQMVFCTQQNFLDRTKSKGIIGQLPLSVNESYSLFLNPIPGFGQIPRVRIGYRRYLTAIPCDSESVFGSITPGTCKFALDTGRVKFSDDDILSYLGENIYYDGVVLGSFSLNKYSLNMINNIYPNSVGYSNKFIGLEDDKRYVFFIDPLNDNKYYYSVVLGVSAPTSAPDEGTVYINTTNGYAYISSNSLGLSGLTLKYVDTLHSIEHDVYVQFYRSSVNTSGKSLTPDFKEIWTVDNQIISDGLTSSPFIILPTIPVIDTNLLFKIEQGTPGGQFTGTLLDSSNPDNNGFGYFLDLDSKQFKFYNRKTSSITLQIDTPSIKLNDSVVSLNGFKAYKNGNQIQYNTDFEFNNNTGMIDFLLPVGENDPENIIGISGDIELPSTFYVKSGTLDLNSLKDKYLLVKSGLNTGVYKIIFSDANSIIINGQFQESGLVSADVRQTVEIVADRFWKNFKPSLKKIKLYKGQDQNGPFELLDQSLWSVISTNGQINLLEPAKLGDLFKIEYFSLDSTSDGASTISTPHTEFSGFKIRQENATYTINTNEIHFNPNSRTVVEDLPISLYVNGITQDNSNFRFEAPGTIHVSYPLVDQQIVIDYYVMESTGGNTSFTLNHTPVDVDFPIITSGESSVVFNGDQTELVTGSPILVDDSYVILVASSAYDQNTDSTTVTFNPTPTVTTTSNSVLKYTQTIINSDYLRTETLNIDTITKGNNFIIVYGQSSYQPGTIILVNDDPYYVVTSSYNVVDNTTKIVLSTTSIRNYIIPTIRKTMRPVMNPTSEFKTSKPAHTGFNSTLVLDSNGNGSLLNNNVDYSITDGGSIKLSSNLSYGDTFYIFYVARNYQSHGDIFEFNYAHQIVPNLNNGIQGQKLSSSYNLYNPDTFFYRIESITSFMPEVIDELKNNSSVNSSGPNISNVSSLKTKDYGISSLYFDEQHYQNIDIVVCRLLQLYNDQINAYEDILANIDGRVVGGTNGRFRFNNDTTGVVRQNYIDVLNDVDDKIKLYDILSLFDIRSFSFSLVPVYGPMWDYNNYSRLFGTLKSEYTVAINNQTSVSQVGSIIGSFGIENITSVSPFVTTPSRDKFIHVGPDGITLTMSSNSNGNTTLLNPPFFIGQAVKIYSHDGVYVITSVVNSIIISNDHYNLIINDQISIQYGSVVADISDTTRPYIHVYQNGKQVSVNVDNGQIINSHFSPDDTLIGNELLNSNVTFLNKNTTPTRIPALDGLELNDNSFISIPPLLYNNETLLYNNEIVSWSGLGVARPDPLPDDPGPPIVHHVDTNVMVDSTLSVSIGSKIHILSGQNVGSTITVTGIISSNSFYFSPMIHAESITSLNMYVESYVGDLISIVNDETNIMKNNNTIVPSGSSVIGTIQSELKSATNIIQNIGYTITSGFGIVSTSVLTDTSKNFELVSPSIDTSCYIFINSDHDNFGLYKILSISDDTITIDTSTPYGSFQYTQSTPYTIIKLWPFFTSKQTELLSKFIRETLAQVQSNSSWINGMSVSGIISRQASVSSRIQSLNNFKSDISYILSKNDKMYDMRYLLIQQRVDKKNGTLTKVTQSISKRQENTEKLISDQQKSFILNKIV